MLTKSYVNAQKPPLVNLIQISAKALNVSFLDLPLGGRTLQHIQRYETWDLLKCRFSGKSMRSKTAPWMILSQWAEGQTWRNTGYVLGLDRAPSRSQLPCSTAVRPWVKTFILLSMNFSPVKWGQHHLTCRVVVKLTQVKYLPQCVAHSVCSINDNY